MADPNCITISSENEDDDDDVEIIEQFIRCEPIVVDLENVRKPKNQKPKSPEPRSPQPNIQQPPNQQLNFQQHQSQQPKSPKPKSQQPAPNQQLNGQQHQSQQSQSQQSQSQQPQSQQPQGQQPQSQQPQNQQPNSQPATIPQPQSQQPQSQQHPYQRPNGQIPQPNSQQPEIQRPEIHRPSNRQSEIQRPNNQQPEIQRPNIQRPQFQGHTLQQPEAQQPKIQQARVLTDRELMIAKKEKGNEKFRCNAFDEAVRCYREGVELSKKLDDKEMAAILHFNLAMAYDKLGSYAQAADECAAAVKINDQYIKAHVKRAEIYMARGKYEEAVICYEHICEIDPSKRRDAMQRIAVAKELAKTMKKPDQYETLGLRPFFTAEQLKAAYKQKARAHHPDRHSDADVVTRRIHERIFKEASEANNYFRKRFNYH